MKEIIKYIIMVLAALVIGIGLGNLMTTIEPNPTPEPIIEIDTTYQAEKIHELENNCKEKEEYIKLLKSQINSIKSEVIIEKERIMELPIDSNISLLRDNLCIINDSLPPSKYLTTEGDTMIVIDESNIKDINITYLNYQSSCEINKILEEIIESDNSIISNKDSIIIEKNDIINIQNNNIELLQTTNKKLKTTTIITGIVAIILGGLLICQ